MPQSEQIGELAKAIAAAQANLKPVKKECENPFFKSRYADLAAVWEALKPFHAEGIAITQIPFDAGEGMVGITTQLTHISGQWIAGSLALPVSKDDAQGVGSAITYCRRYSLGCMTGVVTEDDDDGNQATHAKPAQRYQQSRQANTQKLAELRQSSGMVLQATYSGVERAMKAEADAHAHLLDGIDDETWTNFCEYVGDDPGRTAAGKTVKKKMSISEMSSLPARGRKAVMLSIQDEAKRQGIPFREWVKES